MFTYQFWQLAIERAVKTFAQSLLAIFSTGVGLLTVLRGSGCGGGPECGRGRLHLVGGVPAATQVASSRPVSGEAGS